MIIPIGIRRYEVEKSEKFRKRDNTGSIIKIVI